MLMLNKSFSTTFNPHATKKTKPKTLDHKFTTVKKGVDSGEE